MGDDASSLGQRRVPLVHQRLDALHFRRQFTVISHLLEDVKDGLGTHLTDGQNAHAGDEHVHLGFDHGGRALNLEQRERHRCHGCHGGQQQRKQQPGDARKQGTLGQATGQKHNEDADEEGDDAHGEDVEQPEPRRGHFEATEGDLPNWHSLHLASSPHEWLTPTQVSMARSKWSQPLE